MMFLFYFTTQMHAQIYRQFTVYSIVHSSHTIVYFSVALCTTLLQYVLHHLVLLTYASSLIHLQENDNKNLLDWTGNNH